jgi:hypothetical protein
MKIASDPESTTLDLLGPYEVISRMKRPSVQATHSA